MISRIHLLQCVFGGVALVASCSAGAQSRADPLFSSSFRASGDDESHVVGLIGDELNAGFEHFDLDRIRPLLAGDFERRIMLNPKQALVESRAAYIAARSSWSPSQTPLRTVTRSPQSIHRGDDGSMIDVALLTEWRSPLFAPRFLEILTFSNAKGAWLLSKQVLVPLHPARPRDHEVSILVAEGSGGRGRFIAEFNRDAVALGPDAILSRLKPLERGRHDADLTFIAVFREPPPPGSEVELDLDVEGACSGYFSSDHAVEQVTPYAVFAAWGRFNRCVWTVTVYVRLDNKKLARREISFR